MKKDLNWFKEQLNDIEMNTPRLWLHDSIWMLDRVYELLNQLDKPEVEKDQKYILSINITDKASKTNYETYLNKRGIFHSMDNESFNSEEFNWTEEEIKDLENGEILFEHFAVKVEEEEEYGCRK